MRGLVTIYVCLMFSLPMMMSTRAARLFNDRSINSLEELEAELRALGVQRSLESLEEDLDLAERLSRQFNAGTDVRFDTITGQALGGAGKHDKKCTSDHLPDISNVELKCRVSGCRGTCMSGYSLPGGVTRFTLICDTESGQLTYNDRPFRDTLPECQPMCGSGCENGGVCSEPGKCSCLVGYEGDLCETQVSCVDPGLQVLNGAAEMSGLSLSLTCDDGFELNTADNEISFECQSGAWPLVDILPLVDPGTGIIICRPSCFPECSNGGVCTGPGRCSCQRGFWGPRCDVQRCSMPKQVIPHTSMGGTLSRMTIKCHEGFMMHGGDTGMQIQCQKGNWMMPDHKTPFTHEMAHCEPVCQNVCQNGGTCVAPDQCQCPAGVTGDVCQHN